ncbi:hypothetical protein F4803DRAFT_497708 [Xylaria telfairii]|nr:hypothetical protein F4803DRAFT_497708 [Xylaria telfairii]
MYSHSKSPINMQICKALSIITLAAAAVAVPTSLPNDTNSVPPLPGSENYHFACWNRNLEEYCDGKAVCGASGMVMSALKTCVYGCACTAQPGGE